MLKDITLGQYIPADTPIHKLDARTKILATVGFITVIFLINKISAYILVFLFLLLVVALGRISVKHLLKSLKPVALIIVFTAVLNMLMTPGDTIFKFYFINITQQGVRLALFMSLRLILLIAGASIMTLTTSPIALTDGIEKLLSPGKKIGLPAHELAMMMTIALRFIPTLLEETDKIMKAQMARGADFESGNIIRRAKALVPIIVPLFVSAFRRAEELAMAMEARCYRGDIGRTRMKQLKFGWRDTVATLVFIVFTGSIVASRFV